MNKQYQHLGIHLNNKSKYLFHLYLILPIVSIGADMAPDCDVWGINILTGKGSGDRGADPGEGSGDRGGVIQGTSQVSFDRRLWNLGDWGLWGRSQLGQLRIINLTGRGRGAWPLWPPSASTPALSLLIKVVFNQGSTVPFITGQGSPPQGRSHWFT